MRSHTHTSLAARSPQAHCSQPEGHLTGMMMAEGRRREALWGSVQLVTYLALKEAKVASQLPRYPHITSRSRRRRRTFV